MFYTGVQRQRDVRQETILMFDSYMCDRRQRTGKSIQLKPRRFMTVLFSKLLLHIQSKFWLTEEQVCATRRRDEFARRSRGELVLTQKLGLWVGTVVLKLVPFEKSFKKSHTFEDEAGAFPLALARDLVFVIIVENVVKYIKGIITLHNNE
ncbi:uncharacterized protein EV154DRAFT_487999 [Mucor mucedo]|uniref:uncharacterized protein n=1 Tax=Mucor mucedo TaxID=29922 RepID=UPI00221F3E70|nr:uncharacterized protein EV154DRAFT_487999 [Mucor mucedo]KAI7869412.1 hypothetical protein EV154DRAFT_487999 [Mucor mucedo]